MIEVFFLSGKMEDFDMPSMVQWWEMKRLSALDLIGKMEDFDMSSMVQWWEMKRLSALDLIGKMWTTIDIATERNHRHYLRSKKGRCEEEDIVNWFLF